MCLVIKESFIAEQDIVCYKVVDRDYKSPCQGFQYEIGKIYKSILCSSSTKFKDHVVEEGLHSFSNYDSAVFNLGINSWKRLNEKASGDAVIILECIIPKGSKVYKGIYGDYASNYLKVVKRAS